MTRILIIDDEPVTHETLAALLAGEEYELDFALDGPTGIAKAKANTPDIILLDLMMPGMDGYTVCTHLRSDELLAEVPILMITAFSDRKSRLQGLTAGADDFLAKPIDGLDLLARLRTIARLNRYRRLQAERTRLRWVMDRALHGYLVLDSDSKLLYANAPAYRFLGIEASDALPDIPFVTLAASTYRLEPAAVWSAWPATPLHDGCYLVRPETVTAPAFWLRASEQRLQVGDAVQILLLLQDVTEMMTTWRDMRSFRTVLSHKLRTPLNAVVGLLALLQDYPDTTPLAEVRDLLVESNDAAARLHAEVEDVFTYVAGLAIAEQTHEPASFDLTAAIESVRVMLGVNSAAITLDTTTSIITLPVSRGAFEQTLFELLENSQKFHPTHTPSITITVREEAAGVRIAVGDDGVTLSPQQLQWAMTPYLQGEKYFTGETPGMGLGLSLVAAIVWQASGEVGIRNRRRGPGVVVELWFPTPGAAA